MRTALMNRHDRKPRAIAIARTQNADRDRLLHIAILSAYAASALAALAICLIH
jgi:hypothetical protein